MVTEAAFAPRPEHLRQNAFGMAIPSISALLSDPVVFDHINFNIAAVLAHIGVPSEQAEFARQKLLMLAQTRPLEQYEREGHQVLTETGAVAAVSVALLHRAELIYSQIVSHVVGLDVCDLGCGDGRVGVLLSAAGKAVTLSDVYRHPNIDASRLRFELIGQNDRLPFLYRSFDTTLLLTVLHHADNPLALLRESVRVTRPGGRVILIESVFGVSAPQGAALGAHEFLSLSYEQQRLSSIFFDHFYNRLIHYSDNAEDKVNVPFNFNTPMAWEALLKQCGAAQIYLEHLGIDQKAVPEYHTLHLGVVDR